MGETDQSYDHARKQIGCRGAAGHAIEFALTSSHVVFRENLDLPSGCIRCRTPDIDCLTIRIGEEWANIAFVLNVAE